MKNNDFNSIWIEIESHPYSPERYVQRMVYVDLLYRAYIGSSGTPAKRFLALEIPQNEETQFDSFTVPKGFTLNIGKPHVKHDGYSTCVLQASNSDQNDVFAIVVKDILDSLRKEKEANSYIKAMKRRIEKWRDFFKTSITEKLSEKVVIGLIGELSFIKELKMAGVDDASDFWNGPIKAAQDFQGEKVAIEVKTVSANKLENVHISSETQLDSEDREALFLIAYRVERNDATGIKLPDLIQQVSGMLNEQQRTRFWAKLICLGYINENKNLYTKGYSLKENNTFLVKDGFPRILRADLPQGVMDVKYMLALQSCDEYTVELKDALNVIRELEYGEE